MIATNPSRTRTSRRALGGVALASAVLLAAPSVAQFQFNPDALPGGEPFASDPRGDAEPDPADLVKMSARWSPATDTAPAMVAVTAKIADGYHVYSLTQPNGGPQPTTLRIEGAKLVGEWVPDPAPKTHIDQEIWVGLTIEEHFGQVTWRAPIEVPAGADPASVRVTGVADLQACTEATCHAIRDAKFVAEPAAPGSIPAPSAGAARVPSAGPAGVAAAANFGELLPKLGLALLGGLILNLMPCVLPVIGLKVLSFAQQAGHRRGQVLAMNLAYTAGLLSVFLLLATLAAFASYGWGELYTHAEFKIGMAIFVFAMALSFLGVWEIPLPGFAGGRGANNLQQKEGYSGAFFKGIFTTILATPCSGPFLGSVIGYTLTQPTWVTYAIFTAIGLGMASPYLLIGLFPSLVKSLPKPGAWMETFKQFMGFVLMGTVVFLFAAIDKDQYLPVLATLVAVGFGCWWIGSMPLTASGTKRTTAWLGGAATAVAVGWAAFTLLGPSEHELPWRPFTPAALAAAQADGKTVLVDFTANWCQTCQANSKFAINTRRVREVVQANGVTPLLADWTDGDPLVKQTLNALGSDSIPFLAIYPAGRAVEPILLPDVITESQLLAALAQAGAVQANAAATELPEIEIGEVPGAETRR